MKYEEIKVGDKFVYSGRGFPALMVIVTVTKALPKGGFRLSNERMFKERIPFWLTPLTPELQAEIDLAQKRKDVDTILYRLGQRIKWLPESVLDKILEAHSEWDRIERAKQAEGRQG